MDFSDKNKKYREEVEKIAKFLSRTFGFGDDDEWESAHEDYLDRADKIYRFFDSSEDAKKAFRFLNVVNPVKAKEIVDEL